MAICMLCVYNSAFVPHSRIYMEVTLFVGWFGCGQKCNFCLQFRIGSKGAQLSDFPYTFSELCSNVAYVVLLISDRDGGQKGGEDDDGVLLEILFRWNTQFMQKFCWQNKLRSMQIRCGIGVDFKYTLFISH